MTIKGMTADSNPLCSLGLLIKKHRRGDRGDIIVEE
jgi:hypothetical protein